MTENDEPEQSTTTSTTGAEEAERAERQDRFDAAIQRSQQQLRQRLNIDSDHVSRFPTDDSPGSPQRASFMNVAPGQTVRARMILMGFRCVRPTWDHAGNADGWGDEIYMTSSWGWMNPDGSAREAQRNFRTHVYGQRRDQGFLGPVFTKWPQRIELGRANRFGGFREGDWGGSSIPPWDTHQQWFWPVPGTAERLPQVMWEWVGPADQLTGTMVASPTIWEGDWGAPLDPAWGDTSVTTIAEIFKIAGKGAFIASKFLGPYAAATLAFSGIVTAIGESLVFLFQSARGIIGLSGDRPIGQRADGSARTYDAPVVTIDLSRAAQAAATNTGWGPGIFVCPVQDSSNIGGGHYQSFIAFTYEIV